MHGPHSSLREPCGAAIQAEARKRHDYRDLPEGILVTPFAIESTGRLGPAAADLLPFLCVDHPAHLKFYIKDLSICLAASIGRLLSFSRGRIAAHPSY